MRTSGILSGLMLLTVALLPAPAFADSSASDAITPAYQTLAVKNDTQTRVIDLPGSLFAVQLLAVSTRKQIEDYAEAHDLRGLTAVTIAQKGKRLYALIPGVYRSREAAAKAVASLPAAVQASKPWVRPLASLQGAMRASQTQQFAESGE